MDPVCGIVGGGWKKYQKLIAGGGEWGGGGWNIRGL